MISCIRIVATTLLLLHLAFSQSVMADCLEVDMSLPGKPFSKIPVYNQVDLARAGDLNICSSISGAELIDANRLRKDPLASGNVAPLSVAINYKMLFFSARQLKGSELKTTPLTNQILANGALNENIVASRNEYVCDEKFLNRYLKDEGASFLSSSRIRIGKTHSLASTENFLTSIVEQSSTNRKPILDKLSRSYDRLELSDPEQQSVLGTYFCIQMASDPSRLSSILKALTFASTQDDSLNKINSFVAKFCENNHFLVDFLPPEHQVRWEIPGDTKAKVAALKTTIDGLLGKPNSQPVGIAFCRNVYMDAGYEGVADDGKSFMCRPHASVIIGERKTLNGCEYLVRDSYGDDCTNSRTQKLVDAECDHKGNIWVGSEALLKSIRELTWIPDDK
jgi:hypothetical protein